MPQVYSHGFPLYWDVRLIVELSGEHPHLPFAELEVVGTVIDRRTQVAVVECRSPQTTRRLALAHAVLEYLGESAADRESFTAMVRDLGITAEGPFAARVRKMAGSFMETPVPDLERLIGSIIGGKSVFRIPPASTGPFFPGTAAFSGRCCFVLTGHPMTSGDPVPGHSSTPG